MENVNAIHVVTIPRRKYRLHHKDKSARGARAGLISVLNWYWILRAHYQWPLFQAIRYALWLAR